MSIRFTRSCFVHIPRTGGTWLQSAAVRALIKCQVLKGDVDSHFTWRELPEFWRSFPSFSFVREPLSWTRSRWSHLIEHQMVNDYRHYGVHRLFDELVQPSFEETIKNILKVRPGLVGRTYREMLLGVELTYQTEKLPSVFVSDFQQIENLTEAQCCLIKDEPPCNGTSEPYREKLSLPESLQSEFLSSEQEATAIWKNAKG